jgi:hypothetical protein
MGSRSFVVGMMIIAGGCAVTPRERVAAPPTPAPVTVAAAPTTAPAVDARSVLLLSAIYELQAAPTSEAAKTAYARGVAIDPRNVALNRLYVQRMVDLESPELGYDAAQIVVSSVPTDGLARAVLAFTQAERGLMDLAARNIDIAVKSESRDPFVQDTAGHLLAWFDRAVAENSIPATTQSALRRVHLALDNEIVFGEAYQDASLYYLNERRQSEAEATTRPAVAPPPAFAIDGPVGGAQVPNVQPAVEYFDEVAPIAEPLYFMSPGFIVVTDFFGDFGRRMHPPRHVRHHDVTFAFRDHFFGRGYRTFPAAGVRGVTATAYLRDRFPASFGNVVQATAFSRKIGSSPNATYSNGLAPGRVIPGSPGFTAFNPIGVQSGGAVNIRAMGVNPMSFGAIGPPPGVIAIPAPAITPPGRAVRPARGTTAGRVQSNGR